MQKITVLSNDAYELVFMTLTDGSSLQLEFVYRPRIQRWHLNVVHPFLTLNGYNLCVSPNILRPWKNTIPFGIAVTSTDGQDPVDINDLINGRVSIFILQPNEIAMIESEILAPIPLVNA